MTASDVEYTVQKRDVELMLLKKHWYDSNQLGFRKKPDCSRVTVVNRNEVNVLLSRDIEGNHRFTYIVASAPIASKSL